MPIIFIKSIVFRGCYGTPMVFFLYPIEFPIWCSEHLYILLVNIVEHWLVLLYLFFVYRVEERQSNLIEVLLGVLEENGGLQASLRFLIILLRLRLRSMED